MAHSHGQVQWLIFVQCHNRMYTNNFNQFNGLCVGTQKSGKEQKKIHHPLTSVKILLMVVDGYNKVMNDEQTNKKKHIRNN